MFNLNLNKIYNALLRRPWWNHLEQNFRLFVTILQASATKL